MNDILQKDIRNDSLHGMDWLAKTSYGFEAKKQIEKRYLTKSELDLQMAQILDEYLISVFSKRTVFNLRS